MCIRDSSRRASWIFETGSASTAHSLAARNGIQYLLLGEPERKEHPLAEARFSGAPDLFEPEARGKARDVSRAVDAVRARFGFEAMQSARLVGRPDPRRAEADGDAD